MAFSSMNKLDPTATRAKLYIYSVLTKVYNESMIRLLLVNNVFFFRSTYNKPEIHNV
jgi:hypothetical protein